MNKLYLIILSILVLGVFAGCKKELDSENVSKVTTYAILKLNGDEALTLDMGGTFSDPGLVAKIGDEDVTSQVKTTGSVDSSTPGVYTITYSVVNKDSFPASIRRFVGVIDPQVKTYDLSGTYFRVMDNAPQSGRVVNVTKGKYPGLYINDNPGGVLDADEDLKVDVYLFHTEVDVIGAPAQPTALGDLEGADGSYDPEINTYIWTVLNPRFGAAPRIFAKQ